MKRSLGLILLAVWIPGAPASAEEISKVREATCVSLGNDSWQVSLKATTSCTGTEKTISRKMYIRTGPDDATECALRKDDANCTLYVSSSGKKTIKLSVNCYTKLSPAIYNSGQEFLDVSCPEPAKTQPAAELPKENH